MALVVGARLGPYEIVSPLGAGGMGEVYRAHDTKLGRDVALKVLPDSLASDPERVARFEREAHLLALLNHPHIAQIHGVEDSTSVPALVMELVEGPTLADRIAHGPIPIDEALSIAKQTAEALEAAHEQGIVHRDLKPANIKVRADGTVKVLDFGLAKAFDPGGSGSGSTMLPTLSVHATRAGIILGTAAYMAPEQARGKSVDKRADIWAFGCVLFEMLAGRRAFNGDDVSITLASVLKSEPDWRALPPTPAAVRRLLMRCLNKDPKNRLQAIGDARVEIGELLGGTTEPVTATLIMPSRQLWRRAAPSVATLLVGSVVTGTVVWLAARSMIAPPRVARFEVAATGTATLAITGVSRDLTIAPDGSRVVYVGANGTTLFVRPLDRLEATPVVQGDALRDPFISPDSQWVGFFDGPLTLKKVPISGGPAVVLAQLNGAERGATWAPDGTIIFASTGSGLQRISSDGGAPVVLVKPDPAGRETGCLWPEQLPANQAILCTLNTTTSGIDSAVIALLDLSTRQSTILLRGGSHAQYVASGHLVFGAAGTLRAVGFDPRRRIILGTARTVVPRVRTSRTGAIDVALAGDGTLAYVAGGAETGGGSGSLRTLVWVDRRGRETPLAAPPRLYAFPRVSPDGTRIALGVVDVKPDIWLWDLARATLTRLTLGPFAHAFPVWRPDGRELVFSSDRAGGVPNLFRQAADGTGTIEQLTESPHNQSATAFAPDSTRLVFTELSPNSGQDVMALRLDGSRQALPLVQTRFNESNGAVSPEGRWLAYDANDSGTYQIYVRPFPDLARGQWQVSTSGGRQPAWARSGRELFWVAPDGRVMGVAVAGGPTWTAGAPTKVLEGHYVVSTLGGGFPRDYDIAADGRFLMMKTAENNVTSAAPQIIVVQHFDEELKRLVPAQ